MYDFYCTDPNEMFCNILADRVSYFKESKEGVSSMCKMLEEMREEAKIEDRKDTALKMLFSGKFTINEVAEFSKLPVEIVKTLLANSDSLNFNDTSTDTTLNYMDFND